MKISKLELMIVYLQLIIIYLDLLKSKQDVNLIAGIPDSNEEKILK